MAAKVYSNIPSLFDYIFIQVFFSTTGTIFFFSPIILQPINTIIFSVKGQSRSCSVGKVAPERKVFFQVVMETRGHLLYKLEKGEINIRSWCIVRPRQKKK